MGTSGEGVQVVFVEDDGRYRCEEAALRRVVGSGAVCGLPVAVVSVAGAMRGGKSFLLDFFLRYLLAPEEARRSGTWIGDDDEPLTGFSWRGGCDRHTEGILLWSDPIVVTLGSGKKSEKVAVVLLDTQGAFDNNSTMRDSVTVFALSTLLSSVQIYNLSQNIKENDLQYLQLFTEYGKLARKEETETPFQELRFLVRDWCFAYDHAYGAEGGNQLIEKRLEIRAEQASELREIRAQVRGAFEHVAGFLMPHPGLTVAANPTFKGCLKDISAQFKSALLELVPSLLDPENLKVKHVNGQKVTLQDFATYFKSYVEIFNSDTLPTPTTLLQATSAANLEVSLRACREEYATHMKRSGTACVPRGVIPRLHAAALLAARRAFAARRTLAAPELAAASLDALLQELDATLAESMAANNGRILEAVARSKTVYEVAMQSDECLAPDELLELHYSAIASASTAFQHEFIAQPEEHLEQDVGHADESEERESNSEEHDNSSEVIEEDEDWSTLKKELDELLPLHRERNAARIAAALEVAQQDYRALMETAVASAVCLHPQSLRLQHAAAVDTATEHMLRLWHNVDTVPQHHKEELNTYMDDQHQEFVAINDANNETVVEDAKIVYKDIMSLLWNGAWQCVHPLHLNEQHKRGQTAANAYFHERRDGASSQLPVDEHQHNLQRGLSSIYKIFDKDNDTRNEKAVTEAHRYYVRTMTPPRIGGGGDVVLDVLGPPDMSVFSRHPLVKAAAIEQFKMKRRIYGISHISDIYLNDLNKKIEATYVGIKWKLTANFAATAAGIFALGGMLKR